MDLKVPPLEIFFGGWGIFSPGFLPPYWGSRKEAPLGGETQPVCCERGNIREGNIPRDFWRRSDKICGGDTTAHKMRDDPDNLGRRERTI